jgi:hypothetical protein
MRIVAWNCGGGFHRKVAALLALAPDLAIIAECADPKIVALKAPDFRPSGALWVGAAGKKGLGVVSFGAARLRRGPRLDPAITYAIAAQVIGPRPLNLLALWATHGKRAYRRAEPGPGLAAIRASAGFLGKRAAIVAGDLNNHIRWDRPGKAGNHANLVGELAALGLVSAYHAFHDLPQGGERHPTLYWRDRVETGLTYHIDYAFLCPATLQRLTGIAIGGFAEWVGSGLSDHVPLVLDLA